MFLKKIDIENYKKTNFLEIKDFFPEKVINEIKNQLGQIIIDVCTDLRISRKSDKFDYLINKILPIIYKKNKKKGSYIFDVSSRLNIFKNLTNYKKSIKIILLFLKHKKRKNICCKVFIIFIYKVS